MMEQQAALRADMDSRENPRERKLKWLINLAFILDQVFFVRMICLYRENERHPLIAGYFVLFLFVVIFIVSIKVLIWIREY